ncbi:SDR family oxidoreductase [Carboxylicivirga linearis]|uniref:SDR family oxidoreductase n=1 Tax=Carboxylicivirga linearis TaxID=1628157 RepID=A0ABS5JZW3_9BACT|nr:SDR family oxidoreductase [Carboxylicivirga linearis]MBS2100432.1 SDR family oxidoreductase [Carboxylicivirga linearis]
MDLVNKVSLITGGGNGIGKSVAKEYGQQGAIVLIVDKDLVAAQIVVEEIKSFGGQAFAFHVDVSKPFDIEDLFEKIRKDFDRLDILINNAGISKFTSPFELLVDQWDEVINTNLRSVFLCSREAVKLMRKNKVGSIVNIASTRALMSEPNSEAYAASKGGIVALTHAMAASFSKDNIQVNCISPGWIETGDYSQLDEADHVQHLSNRVGKPEDIAKACLYLTQAGNNFINGTNLIIDGGMTSKMIYEEL